jgi:hypothetical protein
MALLRLLFALRPRREFGSNFSLRCSWTLALLLLAPFTAPSQTVPGSRSLSGEPQLPGTISGLVTNNDGEPVAGASLCTEFKNEHGASSSCGSPQTDQHGQFSMHVPLGEVGVYGSKPEDGYLPPAVIINPKGNMVGTTVQLTSDAPTAKVKLKIGPKPAVLTFDVKDKSTGKPVESFRVRWFGIENLGTMSPSEKVPATRVPIPPNLDVIVVISAEGYRRFAYIDPSTSQPILRLASGEERQLDVELEPEEKN